MGTTPSYGCQAGRISNGIRSNATEYHRLELERIARQRNAECEFRNMLTDLKDRIASKAAASTGSGAPAEVFYRAS
jgi:hypothetical protein